MLSDIPLYTLLYKLEIHFFRYRDFLCYRLARLVTGQALWEKMG